MTSGKSSTISKRSVLKPRTLGITKKPSSLGKLTTKTPIKNRLKSNSFKLPLYWVIGHGRMYPKRRVTIPSSTYVVFISKPGYCIKKGFVTQSETFRRLFTIEDEMRKYIHHQITNLPEPFKTWENRTYAPGDYMPEAFIELFDSTDPAYQSFCGVTRVGGATYYSGKTTTVGAIIKKRGPGIYFVFACRQTPDQELSTAEMEYRANLDLTGGIQTRPILGGRIRNTGVYTRNAIILEESRNKRRTLKHARTVGRVKIRAEVKPRTRNYLINRIVMNQVRLYPMALVSEIRNLAHQSSQINGKNYTMAEINNSIRRLKYNNYM